ncbi:hypothetical protein Lal_00043058 [Lupinus albus]|nr:hypothetical protein Lal_00043058 [Lupinus albus]
MDLESCEMKVSCPLRERSEESHFRLLLSHTIRCFSFCYFESSCFTFNHLNFRYSFLFLIKRMASSYGNPRYFLASYWEISLLLPKQA